MRALLLVFVLSACKFDPPDASGDAPIASEVRFTSVSSNASTLRPGRYGVEVTAVLHNGLDEPIMNVQPTLVFRQGATNHDPVFRWRDADARDGVTALNPTTVAAGADATFQFRVDALANAALEGAIQIDGVAGFDTAAGAREAALLEEPFTVPFEVVATIVVNTTTDEINGSDAISFRDALVQANASNSPDRITFDPKIFPPDQSREYLINQDLGPMPPLNGDLVIDGSGAGFVLAANDSNPAGNSRTSLRLVNGTLVVSGIRFRNLSHQYPPGDDCPNTEARRGGAVWADGGTLILDGNEFSDPMVPQRDCHGAAVRISAGSAHRILNNRWTDQTMDALLIAAQTLEVSDNIMESGDPGKQGKTDDGVVIDKLDNHDLWVIGNLFVDHEFSGIRTIGPADGTLHIVNNTFVRNRDRAVQRAEGSPRRVVMHNNAYLDNLQQAIAANNQGASLEISYEALHTNNVLCTACEMATKSNNDMVDLLLAKPAGTTRADFTPAPGSPLLGAAQDLLDRNGRAPGRFYGSGPDRGAVERQE